MASGSASQGVDITALKAALYDACAPLAEENPRMVFNQASIFDLSIIPNNDVNVLLAVAQALVDDRLFKILQSEGLAWRLRSVEDARKYRCLKPEHEAVYGLIDDAGDEGIWSKTIKTRLNLHDAVFRAAIKNLESKNMISDMKSVEHPARKMYIKSSIRPSDRATGGPWYTDGELDEEFIAQMMNVLYDYIRKKSFYFSGSMNMKKPKRTSKKMTTEEVKALRNKGLGPRDLKKEEVDDEKTARKRRYDSYLPMPAGYQGYPTLNELTAFVENAKVTDITLTASEIQQLLDLMCYDQRIERIISGPEGVLYKALKKTLMDDDDGPNNVLMEAPCGRCPVFDLCEEGGPVGPSNCEYFSDWLDL